MRQHIFGRDSEIVAKALYNSESRILYLTFRSGGTTIAYCDVPPFIFEELQQSFYPDVCIRFKIQARYPFRRIRKGQLSMDESFVK